MIIMWITNYFIFAIIIITVHNSTYKYIKIIIYIYCLLILYTYNNAGKQSFISWEMTKNSIIVKSKIFWIRCYVSYFTMLLFLFYAKV